MGRTFQPKLHKNTHGHKNYFCYVSSKMAPFGPEKITLPTIKIKNIVAMNEPIKPGEGQLKIKRRFEKDCPARPPALLLHRLYNIYYTANPFFPTPNNYFLYIYSIIMYIHSLLTMLLSYSCYYN